MRATANDDGMTVKAYAGTTGVLLAMNVDGKRRKGLLGFALERKDGHADKPRVLSGMLPFPGQEHEDGVPIPTTVAPVQKFRWSDYTVYPDTEYEYTVHPVYGTPAKPEVKDGPTVKVHTNSDCDGDHCVLFNRAAAASQAFVRKFPKIDEFLKERRKNKEKEPDLPPDVKAWLSRGVLEQIVKFIGRAANSTWGLDIAIYEYEHPEILEAVEQAHQRGVKLRILYHAKPKDPQTQVNIDNLKTLPAAVKKGRKPLNIHHNKFVVLSRIHGDEHRPIEVLCGSTNFTFNGVYLQANVVHVVKTADAARQYLDLFEVLWAHPETPRDAIAYIDSKNAFRDDAFFIGFSPRSKRLDLARFVSHVTDAKRDVLFCTAFDLYKDILDALLGKPHDPILRFGLQNKKSTITGFHADRTADFEATALLNTGLEGFQKESFIGQKGSIHIHTKIVVTDFTSDHPTVISGSHNLSDNASSKNDENYLIVRDNTDVADTYGVEVMRLYDHYRYRFIKAAALKNKQKTVKRPELTPSSHWTDRYFVPGLAQSDRLRFVGL